MNKLLNKLEENVEQKSVSFGSQLHVEPGNSRYIHCDIYRGFIMVVFTESSSVTQVAIVGFTPTNEPRT